MSLRFLAVFYKLRVKGAYKLTTHTRYTLTCLVGCGDQITVTRAHSSLVHAYAVRLAQFRKRLIVIQSRCASTAPQVSRRSPVGSREVGIRRLSELWG